VCSNSTWKDQIHNATFRQPFDLLTVTITALQNEKVAEANSSDLCPILAPQVRLELTTLRLTAGCSAIELLRNNRLGRCGTMREREEIFITDGYGSVKQPKTAHFYLLTTAAQKAGNPVNLHCQKNCANICCHNFQGKALQLTPAPSERSPWNAE
jgi:hypothetical protein